MRTVFRTTLIAMQIFTVPAAAAVIDPEPQSGTSLVRTNEDLAVARQVMHRCDDDGATNLTGFQMDESKPCLEVFS